MLTIGVDAHKETHVAVAVDAAGQECGQWAGPNSAEGWAAIRAWAQGLGTERRWGIEGAWNDGRGLAQVLVTAGELVHEVNARSRGQGAAARAQPQQDRSARRPGDRPVCVAGRQDVATGG